MSLRQVERVSGQDKPMEMKKGAGASPLFVIDAPNRLPSRGSVPATPGSQSYKLTVREQTACQPWLFPRVTLDLIESTAVCGGRHQECSSLPGASLQKPTKVQPDSPLFVRLSRARSPPVRPILLKHLPPP